MVNLDPDLFVEIDDNTGNNNQQLNPGETVILSIPIKNFGNSSVDNLSIELTSGSDSSIFLSAPIEADIVRIILIIINKDAVNAVNLDKRLAEPLTDIIPPRDPPPPKPKPSLSDPCKRTKITNKIAKISCITIRLVINNSLY